ncbi:cytochrome c oxidase subunit I [Rhodothermus marinus]|uniref:cytochrome c oxidase subunit I n=1 Tax=Rhodothermus marinus TaxID=29549 RepID=UPI0012BA5455|nr:cytochrome c oxidase subunit I [Rhodothermus marinus]BBM68384.1 cytochrome c oxidase subunit 1 [Rhodothermus marinus]BBM71353.1 cytochrome c oxidase subunit 1 [Rhodothermus marinus]
MATQTIAAQKTAQSEINYLNHARGLKSWLLTLDHKRIGILYLISVVFFFIVGGILALLIRAELFEPGQTLMTADTYNHIFTLHGAIMIFLFLIPAVPAVLGNFALPIMIGAKDVAFPRLNLASWYIFWLGALTMLVGIVTSGLDTGWTFYTPYSTMTSSGVTWVVLGIFILGFSSILTGLNFIVTVHKMRAPGLTWSRLPLFVWGLYATSIVQILATPVLGITLLLLALERILKIGIFDPALGGDPILFQHFFWFYSHPAVYIMILPAFGVISELIGTFSRKGIFGYKFVALSSVAIAFLGFLVWGHHMFVSGQSATAATVFSLLTFLIGVPTGVKVLNWVASLYRGSIWLRTPLLYALAFLFVFPIGGFTGIALGTLGLDVPLHDTYFVVAHFHYVMVSGGLLAFLGGLHYWWPKMFGRLYNEKLAQIAALLIFVGFNVTFFPQFILGTQGMPRRYFDYVPEFTTLHQLSTVGSWILGLGLLLVAVCLLHSLFKGQLAPANPWGAGTLEWTHTGRLPSPHNFERTPVVTRGPYDYHLAEEIFGNGHGDGGGTPAVIPAQGQAQS